MVLLSPVSTGSGAPLEAFGSGGSIGGGGGGAESIAPKRRRLGWGQSLRRSELRSASCFVTGFISIPTVCMYGGVDDPVGCRTKLFKGELLVSVLALCPASP